MKRLGQLTVLILCFLGLWYALLPGPQAPVASARGITLEVTDFGALGDGATDDSAAFQAAIDRLEPTGGTLYLPANRTYIVGDVEINSLYPIWIKSDMGNHVLAGGGLTTWADKGNIRPPAAGCSYIFKWERHGTIASAGFGAGGGIEGLCFGDASTQAAALHNRAVSTGAVWVDDGSAFTVSGCEFQFILGTALHIDECTYAKINQSKFYFCGDLANTKPVIDAGGEATQAFLWTDRVFIENCYYTHILLRAGAGLSHSNAYHENSGATAAVTFIDGTLAGAHIDGCYFGNTEGSSIIFGGDTSLTNGYSIQNSRFTNFPGANSTIKILANSVYSRLHNLQISAAGQTAPIIEIDAADCTLSNIYTQAGGQIKIDGANALLSGIYCRAPGAASGQYAIDCTALSSVVTGVNINGFAASVCHGIRSTAGQILNCEVYQLDGGTAYTTIGASTIANCRSYALAGGTGFSPSSTTTLIGNFADAGTAHLPRQSQVLTIGLNHFREISDGVAPTNATNPALDDDATNNAQQLTWGASNSDSIYVSLPLPQGFDGARDVTVTLAVSTDNSGGGGIDAASFTVVSTWDNGATPVTDTATDGTPATTLHTISATILAADIPDSAVRLTLLLAPVTHTDDPIRLHDVRIAASQYISNP